MKTSSFLVAAVFAGLTFALWAYVNKPVVEPTWPQRGVKGMAFSPFRSGEDPLLKALPAPAEIDADLKLLADASVSAVRTYSSLGSLGQIPALAARHHLWVAVGAWLDRQHAVNRLEIAAAIRLANERPNVIRVFVGNEVILRGDLTVAELSSELDRVRSAVKQPVSTAEPWHVWIDNPELAAHVDFIGVHLLPYWEGIEVEDAIGYIISRIEVLEKAFPGKRIVIAEVGWPSDGRTRESAVASTSNQALFLRRFLSRAEGEGYLYYLMEAFDQPWKARYEGAVGAYWGVYDVDRQPKFEFAKPIVPIPQWHTLSAVAVIIAALLLGLLYFHSTTLGMRGRSFLAVVVYGAATVAVWVIYEYSQQYLTFTSILIGTVLIFGMLGVIAVLLSEALEWAEARWATARRRPVAVPTAGRALPKVSVHVPAYNEPPEMLKETLDALARLDYPDFEVVVVDNNTKDEAVWRPIEAHCRSLGPRFHFHHVDPLPGFKAGALNHALQQTAADVEIIAVIDSDYQVDPLWLRDLVPAMNDPKVAIVQAPQDYRDDQESAFKAMCYAEYRGFFHIGMITRNERNAIIQHGTMTLVRRTAMEEVGGWATWCITEDAELGLRLFEHGHEAHYLARSYGRGLMPETFMDYKKQRFRWAYGAMQILRRHSRALFRAGDASLTTGQRYHFIAGWLPWLADGLNLIFSVTALGWSIAMIIAPHRVDPPLLMFSMLPLTLFTFKLIKLVHLYVSRVGANYRQTLAAALAGLALSHTVGLAVVKGMLTRNEPFFRTPKLTNPHVNLEGLNAVRQEALFLVALVAAAYCLTHTAALPSGVMIGIPAEFKGPDLSVWVAVLLIQAIPYGAAVAVSLISVLSLPGRWLGDSAGRRLPVALVQPERP